MAYAAGAGLDTTKKCLDGTRMEILKEFVNWINDPDINVPRIFWLHGQAGRGKSATIHTIALQYKNAGALFMLLLRARSADRTSREKGVVDHCS